MQENEKLRAVRSILGREQSKRKDELIFFCKNPDGCAGKHHNAKLSVNLKKDSWNCWVCGWSGKSLIGILKLGDRNTLSRYISDTKGKSYVKGSEEEKLFDVVALPDSFCSLSSSRLDLHGRAARRYLYSRGIERRDILTYKLGFCGDGDYRFRIIIPSFDLKGELNFFVGRNFYEDMGVSYKHGRFDKDIIFNDYMIDWDKPVTIVEGPFDMMKAGDNAIPLQGSIFPDKLFNKIVEKNVTVYMALDVDARKKQVNHMGRLMSYGVTVYDVPIYKCGVNDVGEMTKQQFQSIKRESKRLNNDIDLLRMRITA